MKCKNHNSVFEPQNELILNGVLDALFDSLSGLLKNGMDRRTLIDNFELVLLTWDETIDGGEVFEIDAESIQERVMMRGAVPEGASSYSELTMKGAVNAAKDVLARNFMKQ